MMEASVTQRHGYGCGAACVAFITGRNYDEVVARMGIEKAPRQGYLCPELVSALKHYGYNYTYHRVESNHQREYSDGSIVFVTPTSSHVGGHFLVRHGGLWMDSWINLVAGSKIADAQSGFRSDLPGSPVWEILPIRFANALEVADVMD